MFKPAVLFLTAVLVPTLVQPSHAQTRTAGLSGTVVDQSGAAIAGASVSIRRDATGYTRQATSNRDGGFQIADLAPGEYAVTVTNPGFTVATQRLMLSSGQSERIELTLHVGSLNEDVVVLASEVARSEERRVG